MLTATLKWVGGLEYVGESGTGHAVVLDAGVEVGGNNLGMRPLELLLVGIGGCSGMDIASILTKKRQEVTGITISVKGVTAAEYPKKLTDIGIEFTVTGRSLSEEAVKRAVELSMDKYCSVKATLEGVAKIAFTYKVVSL